MADPITITVNGMVMSAKALLDQSPRASNAEIRARGGLSGP